MIKNPILLEICTASIQDALTAQAAGANRIELNTSLPLGGLTPTPAMLRRVLSRVSIPVIAMSRPRESGFCYSQFEYETLVQDAEWMLEDGAHGIAFGVLTDSGTVDQQRCRQLVETIGTDRDPVFHRAFDLIEDQAAALETLIDCGVKRIMTSGGQPTAWQGRERIAELVEQAADRIEILAAGGIRVDHVPALIRQTGLRQVHAGLSEPAIDSSYDEDPETNQISFYGKLPENAAQFRQSSQAAIREMVDALKEPGFAEQNGG